MHRVLSLMVAGTISGAAWADSHLSEGAALAEAGFKFCQSCHVVRDDDGNVLAGKNSKSGPNLYGVIGRTAGTLDGFKYGKDMVAAGEAGLVWDEESVAAFLLDPKQFLRDYLDNSGARTRMVFKIRADKKNGLSKEDVAANYALFLKEIGPVMEPAAEGDTTDGGEDTATDN